MLLQCEDQDLTHSHQNNISAKLIKRFIHWTVSGHFALHKSSTAVTVKGLIVTCSVFIYILRLRLEIPELKLHHVKILKKQWIDRSFWKIASIENIDWCLHAWWEISPLSMHHYTEQQRPCTYNVYSNCHDNYFQILNPDNCKISSEYIG